MLKKIAILCFFVVLGGCVSEPVDPAFVGTGAIDKDEAAKTRVSLGLTYLKNANYTQAKFNLDKAIEFAPRSGEAHYAMAFYYQQVGENAIAEEYYENALAYSRNDPDVVNSYAVFLCQQGEYEKAKTYYLQAINSRNYVATAETYENLAICTLSHGQKEEAIEYFNSALNHQPTRPRSLFLLAQTYVESGRWEEAKKTLWRYERNAQVNAESLFMQYRIAQGVGDTKAAIGYGDLLNSMFPKHENTTKYNDEMSKFAPAAKVTRKLANVKPTQIASEQLEPENSILQGNVEKIEQTASEKVDTEFSDVNDADIVDENAIADENQTTGLDILADNEQTHENIEKSVENDVFHIVQPKENLYRISLKYNVKMDKLLEWNNLSDASSIRIGTKLRVREPNNNE